MRYDAFPAEQTQVALPSGKARDVLVDAHARRLPCDAEGVVVEIVARGGPGPWMRREGRRLERVQRCVAAAGEPRPTVFPFDVDRKSTRLNSSHVAISYAVFCLKKKKRHSVH